MNTSVLFLIFILIILFCFIGLFSIGETSLFMANPYRLSHLSKTMKEAKRAIHLLKRKDRLLGLILLGNTLTMMFTASVFSDLLSAFNLSHVWSLVWETLILTILILVIGETLPKTIATLYPEKNCY